MIDRLIQTYYVIPADAGILLIVRESELDSGIARSHLTITTSHPTKEVSIRKWMRISNAVIHTNSFLAPLTRTVGVSVNMINRLIQTQYVIPADAGILQIVCGNEVDAGIARSHLTITASHTDEGGVFSQVEENQESGKYILIAFSFRSKRGHG